MKLSEKRKSDLYDAIAEPIQRKRVQYLRDGSPTYGEVDLDMFNLQNEIWRRIHKVLNLEGPA